MTAFDFDKYTPIRASGLNMVRDGTSFFGRHFYPIDNEVKRDIFYEILKYSMSGYMEGVESSYELDEARLLLEQANAEFNQMMEVKYLNINFEDVEYKLFYRNFHQDCITPVVERVSDFVDPVNMDKILTFYLRFKFTNLAKDDILSDILLSSGNKITDPIYQSRYKILKTKLEDNVFVLRRALRCSF